MIGRAKADKNTWSKSSFGRLRGSGMILEQRKHSD